jgi:alpha-galactosidase
MTNPIVNLKKITFYLNVLIIITATIYNVWAQELLRIDGDKIAVEFDDQLRSRVISKLTGSDLILGDFSYSEYLTISECQEIIEFKLSAHSENTFQDNIGNGREVKITGIADNLTKDISVVNYNNFPTFLFFTVTYKNTGSSDLQIKSWTNNNYKFTALSTTDGNPLFWSYQPGSYGWDNDWIQQLNNGFERENSLGMNNVDYGGGTPILDIWRQDVGMAIGHIELVPKFVSLPTSVKTDSEATIAITYPKDITLKPGETLTTFRTFVTVHKGDYFSTLTAFSKIMSKQGIDFKQPPKEAYGTEWCGWGYEEFFSMEQFYGALPMAKKLGIDHATLDMGWQDKNYGYYDLPKGRFPNGDADMKKIVDSIHEYGLKTRLWWMPLSVHPRADLYIDHPEYMIFDKNQSPVYIHFWESFFLCPALPDVQKITKDFVIIAIRDWGWEGLKIDGNSLNTVPPCYNPAHKHAYPEESIEKLPELFKMIRETTLSINPNAVIQICPCGTNQSFYILPYMNQTVASDPHNAWHVRIKGKTLIGLTRGIIPYAGDHIELSQNDFASTVGIGGVIATKFVWPVGSHENKETGDISLTPEKEKEWTKWLRIYNDNLLSKGTYLGELYDIGYDRPECHAIQKDDIMYYSFFADELNGEVELRGLKDKTYQILDYENNKDLGSIKGPIAKLPVSFKHHLLIKAEPK